MVMTVRPGIGGQKYIHECTPKIQALNAELSRQGLEDVNIEVDGGICVDTIDEAVNVWAYGDSTTALAAGDFKEILFVIHSSLGRNKS